MNRLGKSSHSTFRLLALCGALLASVPATGAPGDTLYIRANGTVVHTEASSDAPLVVTLNQGHKLVELRKVGPWVEVSVALSGGKSGWVGYGAVSTMFSGGATLAPLTPEFAEFQRLVEQLNDSMGEVVGGPVFSGVVDKADGIVHVHPTKRWHTLPVSLQEQVAAKLSNAWARIEGSGFITSVDVVEP